MTRVHHTREGGPLLALKPPPVVCLINTHYAHIQSVRVFVCLGVSVCVCVCVAAYLQNLAALRVAVDVLAGLVHPQRHAVQQDHHHSDTLEPRTQPELRNINFTSGIYTILYTIPHMWNIYTYIQHCIAGKYTLLHTTLHSRNIYTTK